MPEIDNSLAASVKPLDVGGALAKAAQLRESTLKGDILQQSYGEREREYQENGGLTSGQRATMSKTQQEAMGPIGNILANDQSPQARQQAISLAKRAGIPMDDMTAGHLMSAPPEQIKQYGVNAQRLGMSSSTNVDQTGRPAGNATRESGKYLPQDVPSGDSAISNRTAVATGTAGQPPVRQITDTIVPNADGSLPSVPKQPAAPSFNDRFKGDMFTPGIVKNPDGTLSSNITPGAQAMRAQAVKQYEKAGEVAQTAQGLSMRLDMMDHSADVLNTTGWSTTGAGANAKLGAAKSVNSLLQTVGLPPAVDPNKVASWEDLNKETTRAGFDLARTLGSREAATIVQSSVSAVPGAENSPMGFKLVSSGIRQAIQREKDYYNFATDYAKSHRGNTFGADVEFNKQFPPDLYSKTAVANAIPPAAINMMKGDPKLASKFDEKYGQGMSAFVLHHDQAR